MQLPRALSSHRPGRLIFAVITLSIALSGVVANYSLSHDTTRALDEILAFDDVDQMLVNVPTMYANEATRRKADADHLHDTLIEAVSQAIPPDFSVTAIRQFESRITTNDEAKSVITYAVGSSFFELSNAQFSLGGLNWSMGQDRCALGANLANEFRESGVPRVRLGGKICTVGAIVHFDERPPFGNLNDSVFVGIDELSYDPRNPLSVSALINGPSDRVDPDVIKDRIGIPLDTAFLQIWSSAARQDEAARLKRLVSIVSNGLGIVILIIGAASIASLMSFSVSERRREIAVRMAIGASERQVFLGILAEALAICLIALVVGVCGGLFLADALKEPLNEFIKFDGSDARSFEFAATLKAVFSFLGIALLASLEPAVRASRIDPSQTLRNT